MKILLFVFFFIFCFSLFLFCFDFCFLLKQKDDFLKQKDDLERQKNQEIELKDKLIEFYENENNFEKLKKEHLLNESYFTKTIQKLTPIKRLDFSIVLQPLIKVNRQVN